MCKLVHWCWLFILSVVIKESSCPTRGTRWIWWKEQERKGWYYVYGLIAKNIRIFFKCWAIFVQVDNGKNSGAGKNRYVFLIFWTASFPSSGRHAKWWMLHSLQWFWLNRYLQMAPSFPWFPLILRTAWNFASSVTKVSLPCIHIASDNSIQQQWQQGQNSTIIWKTAMN